jgi:hypothetical protein
LLTLKNWLCQDCVTLAVLTVRHIHRMVRA